MSEAQLSTKEAYTAMYLFLSELYEKAGLDQLGGILGGMSMLPDGTTADPAYWDDWLRFVNESKSQNPNIGLQLNDHAT